MLTDQSQQLQEYQAGEGAAFCLEIGGRLTEKRYPLLAKARCMHHLYQRFIQKRRSLLFDVDADLLEEVDEQCPHAATSRSDPSDDHFIECPHNTIDDNFLQLEMRERLKDELADELGDCCVVVSLQAANQIEVMKLVCVQCRLILRSLNRMLHFHDLRAHPLLLRGGQDGEEQRLHHVEMVAFVSRDMSL